MNLFFKIFLWFLAATALMVGVALFLTWGLQSDPFISRFQNSARNQIRFHAETVGAILEDDGLAAAERFLDRLNEFEPIHGVALIDADGRAVINKGINNPASPTIKRAFASGLPEADFSSGAETLIASPVTLSNGRVVVLAAHWARPLPPPFLGEPRVRFLRLFGLLLTAILVCYVLARYLSAPLVKLSEAAREFAAGDLATRAGTKIGNRRDEFAKLAADFDEMAERIETLVKSEKRLTRDISHELRSPLARLNVALEIAKQKSGEESGQILERIETESDRLNQMIGRMLTLSQLESGSAQVSMVRLDLGRIVREIAADAEFEAAAKGKSVITEVNGEFGMIGNESLLRSAVENVVRNAIRYTADGTAVRISLSEDGENALIAVEDHGAGVPDDELENLFRPFYRVAEARDRRSGGVGLGLAIARRAVLAHDGSINAANTADGLLISIRLPLTDARR